MAAGRECFVLGKSGNHTILIKYFNCIHIYIVKIFFYFTFMIVENALMADSDNLIN